MAAGRWTLLVWDIPAVSKQNYNGLKVVPAGEKEYYLDAKRCENPRGVEYYWLGKMQMNFDKNKNLNRDLGAVLDGFASLTPITLNLTEESEISNLKEWIKVSLWLKMMINLQG